MAATDTLTLFSPIKIGNIQLQHRIALAPLSRFRAHEHHVHTGLGVQYYEQRASIPGGLLISEGTFIKPQAGGYPHVPGIWNEEQIAAWRKIADAVHAKGCFIFMQLWSLGRSAIPKVLQREGPYDVIGASAIPIRDKQATPRPLTVDEIKEYVQWYAQAAKNAVRAGFDGVEVHSASGYLPDQFLQTTSNQRTDEYGGSVENRIRFVVEIIDAIAAIIGPERTALRLSPWSTFQSMRMADPIPTFSGLVRHFVDHQPRLAYISLVERRVDGAEDIGDDPDENNDFIRDIWSPRPLILAGGFTYDLALQTTDRDKNVLIAMGRYFVSNPDLPKRWKRGVALAPYDQQGFRTRGVVPEGYIDYPMSPDIEL
ncbi:putative NADPH2 dehydrogenase chain OYE2 [Peniophora sp. CONT]|nr:putative NADPH2 dehydrogenase chain OYE2 [Peniophora sp. CONT]